MRQARLGQQNIEREAQRLKTLLNLGLDVSTDDLNGVNFTTTTTGSWQDTGLSIMLTPTSDVYCLGLVRGELLHTAATAVVYARILYDSTALCTTRWDELEPTGNKWIPFSIWGVAELTAGTSYTFKVQLYMTTAGTLYLNGAQYYTELAVILASKAVLA